MVTSDSSWQRQRAKGRGAKGKLQAVGFSNFVIDLCTTEIEISCPYATTKDLLVLLVQFGMCIVHAKS
jgi:hypothetical protein